MSAEYKSNRRQVQAVILKALQDGVAAGAVQFQAAVKKKLSTFGSTRALGNRPAPPGAPPAVQSGTLRRSIQVDLSRVKTRNPVARVGTNLVYARIHEFGGTISGRGLTIPIHPDAKRHSARGGSARTMPGLVMIKRKVGAPLLVRPRGKSGKSGFDLMYVIKKSVRIPMRPYFRPTILEQRKPIERTIQRIVTDRLRRGGVLRGSN